MELPKAYNWKDYEDDIYQAWEDTGYFNPDNLPETHVEPYSIILPPPNATGTLHLGHAMYVIQDIMIRHARMQGKKALWIPGTDHAAIATQSKVESIIMKEEGKTRHDLGREELNNRIDTFVEGSKTTIRNQLRKMGFSLDWSREQFTLDSKLMESVQTMFQKMAEDGLVYKGDRIVNWDPKLQTTVANDEMEYEEKKAPFYYFQYGPFEIGTSRPETKFGDKYVVMHPDDKRYTEYKHGQTFEAEWISGKITATVIKDKSVDPEFGSGVMTITPWHDVLDFEIAERHNLDKEQIIDLEGKLLPIAGEFAGMPIEEARPKLVEKLKEKGLLTRVDEEYEHNVNVNYRGGGVIEPQIMKQWFVAVDKQVMDWNGKKMSLKEVALDVVKSGDITIVPDRFNKTYFSWMENLHDWCISRQLWYGHRIPAWYKKDDIEGVNPVVQVDSPGDEYYQDEDVLDTWFSSGMWTFSTLNWIEDFDFETGKPKPGTDLEKYHPTQVLETGYDILFFWVARMILMTTYGMKQIPFETVYLHGLVRDRDGAKMSKSKGNGIDPLEMSVKYGTDAVRLSLVIGTSPGNDQRLFEEKIAGYRNFINKICNIARFVMMQLDEVPDTMKGTNGNPLPIESKDLALADHWITSRLHTVVEEVNTHMQEYRFSAAAELAYEFMWHEFADWYIEINKFQPNPALSKAVLETSLKLLHPFVPFITEQLWKSLGHEDSLMVAKWPEISETRNDQLEKDFAELQDIITQVRDLRGQYKISYQQEFNLYTSSAISTDDAKVIKNMCKVKVVEGEMDGNTTDVVNSRYKFQVHLGDLINTDEEKQRLQKEIDQLQKYVTGLEKKLGNEQYTSNAPAEVVERDKKNLIEKQESIVTLQESLNKLG